jgi:hypothetical protein
MSLADYNGIAQLALARIATSVSEEFQAVVTHGAPDDILWIDMHVGSERPARFLRTKDPKRATRPPDTPRCWAFIVTQDATAGIDLAIRSFSVDNGAITFHLQIGRVLTGDKLNERMAELGMPF